MMNGHQSEAAMKSFLFGLGVGTAVGLLLAPQAGNQTRAEWAARARSWMDEVQGNVRQEPEPSGETPDVVAEVLNTATQHDLRTVHGIGKATAKKIVENRPYESEEQVLEQGVLSEKTIEKVKEQLVEEKDRDIA
jgi:competence protein ComEA